MSADSFGLTARLEELKDKLDRDPNSKIFLQLAEEYRKVSRFDDAIRVCIAGLKKHPSYTSARVTLGRAYLGAKRLAEAKAEFLAVIAQVPDNILANRALGDILYEEGRVDEALERYRVVQVLSPNDDEVMARIKTLEAGPVPGASRPAPGASATAAAPPGPPTGEDEAFMDLKIDESLILNADMIKATLRAAGAPAAPPVSARPPVAKAPAAAKPVAPPPAGEVSFEGMEDGEDPVGGMGFDDFADFSSPTVMLNVADLAKLAEKEKEKEKTAPPGPAKPAGASPAAAKAAAAPATTDYSSRTADKFGLGGPKDEPVAAPARPAAAPAPAAPAARVAAPVAPTAQAAPKPPVVEDELPAGDVGSLGVDDFSEFAAPTVMLNVSDLLKSGALSESMLQSNPFATVPPAAAPAAPPASETALEAGVDAGASEAEEFSAMGTFSDASAFADSVETEAADAGSGAVAAEPVFGTQAYQPEDAFGTRAFQADELRALAARGAAGAAGGVAPLPPAIPEPEAPGFAAEPADAGFPPEPFMGDDSPLAAYSEPASAEVAAGPLEVTSGTLERVAADERVGGMIEPSTHEPGAWPGSPSPVEMGGGLEAGRAPWPATGDSGAGDDDLTSKTLGQLYLQQGHLDKALEVFERYLASHPGDHEIREKYDEIRRRLEAPAAVAAVAEPAAASAEPTVSTDERKARIRQKLTSWLQSTNKKT